jgi:hypothetical protein
VHPCHYLPLLTTDMDTASNLHPNLHYTNLLQSQTPNLKHINHSHRRMPETYIYESRLRISVRHLLPTTTNLPPCSLDPPSIQPLYTQHTKHKGSAHPIYKRTHQNVASTSNRDQELYQDFLPALARHFTLQPPLKIAHHKFAIHGVVAIHGGKRSSILTRRWRLVNIKAIISTTPATT